MTLLFFGAGLLRVDESEVDSSEGGAGRGFSDLARRFSRRSDFLKLSMGGFLPPPFNIIACIVSTDYHLN